MPKTKKPHAIKHLEKKLSERRKNKRIRLSPLLIEPINIKIPELKSNDPIPGIIADISAVGIAIIAYANIPLGTEITMDFNLLGVKIHKLKGKVSKIRSNYRTYVVVITFDKLQKNIAKQIEKIAMDYEDCETRWHRGDNDFCTKTCGYYHYCSKSIKKEFSHHSPKASKKTIKKTAKKKKQ